jgi:hypothetical protein
MKLNKYLPFAFIYFFINSSGLPFGLTWTAVLAPFFYVWVLLTRKKESLFPFIVILLPFIIIQVYEGLEINVYAISIVNLLLVYIFCLAVYVFFKKCHDPEKIFSWILIVNFILCLIAIPLYFTPYDDWFWMEQGITADIRGFSRLKLFTYEPSYYAFIFTPVFFFFLLQYLFRQNKMPGLFILVMLFTPYIFSFSIGVITASLIALILTWLLWFRKLTSKKRIFNAIISTSTGVFSILMILGAFFRNNTLFSRIWNIFSGRDSSGKGRTFDAFILADKILQTGNEYWGIGIGQIKLVGTNIIRDYYLYVNDFTAVIPNSAAETLVIFGWVGFFLRFFLEIFLFFYTRVWTNYYRLLLFLFMFIYQFTGSFVTNVAEYVIWILAFTNLFHQFDVREDKAIQSKQLSQQQAG